MSNGTVHLSTARRAIAVLEVYQLHKQEDVPDKAIWRRHLNPRFGISYSTFLRYLDMPAQRIVREAVGSVDDKEG